MNIVIVGCGLIGRKRARALDPDDELVACCDTNESAARKFAKDFSCDYFGDHHELLSSAGSTIAIVAVVNKFARQIVIDFLKSGRNVLAEKPLGRNAAEASDMVEAVRLAGPPYPLLKTGFNHRFHPGIRRAKEIVDEGAIGRIFSIRAIYGHGGRPGMENEWRASKDLCGGGELLDQGVHIIDLIRWFAGDVKEVTGVVETKYWNIGVEDNASAVLKTQKGVTATFQVSWTNWKNTFQFEIFGTDGYVMVKGLGGSYGGESLELGKRNIKGGRPHIEKTEFPAEDLSWKNEWRDFKQSILTNGHADGNEIDGLRANQVIEAIYRSSKERTTVFL